MASFTRISLQERDTFTVKMQREDPQNEGEGLGVGMEKIDIADAGVYGPYTTGCEEGRSCIQVGMMRHTCDSWVRVDMESGDQLHVHYRAEDLTGYVVPGYPLLEWWDYLGGSSLAPMGDNWTIEADALNGYPVVSRYDEDMPDGMETDALSGSIDDLTIYMVVYLSNLPDLWSVLACIGGLEGPNYGSGLFGEGLIKGAAVMADGRFKSVNSTENELNSDGSDPDGFFTGELVSALSTGTWHILAQRYDRDLSEQVVMIDGVAVDLGWELDWGNDPLPAQASDHTNNGSNLYFQMGHSGGGGEIVKFAELEARGWADDQETMLARSQELASKYGLPCAGL